MNSLREPVLVAEWGGLLQQSGRPTYFSGGGVATQSLPYFSRIAPASGIGKAVRGGVGWVGSALLINAGI